MASTGQEIVNAATGERLLFLATSQDTSGEYLEFVDYFPVGVGRPSAHVHPGMEERWQVLQGTVRINVGGDDVDASAGEVVVAPPGVPHRIANTGAGTARVLVRMTPALRWEWAVERLFAMASTPGADGDGTPSRDALVAWMTEFAAEIAPPPRAS
jgi:mannose-6-phosphate isomerase-like protein (cupin superfamily)